MKKHYFQVKYGFNANDNVTLEEQEVEKAIYAQIKRQPVELGGQYINGANIIVIRPAYYKHTGWFPTYEPTDGDDMKQIERDCPQYDGVIEKYKERVAYLINSNQVNQIGKGEPILEIEEPTGSNKIIADLANVLKI